MQLFKPKRAIQLARKKNGYFKMKTLKDDLNVLTLNASTVKTADAVSWDAFVSNWTRYGWKD